MKTLFVTEEQLRIIQRLIHNEAIKLGHIPGHGNEQWPGANKRKLDKLAVLWRKVVAARSNVNID